MTRYRSVSTRFTLYLTYDECSGAVGRTRCNWHQVFTLICFLAPARSRGCKIVYILVGLRFLLDLWDAEDMWVFTSRGLTLWSVLCISLRRHGEVGRRQRAVPRQCVG